MQNQWNVIGSLVLFACVGCSSASKAQESKKSTQPEKTTAVAEAKAKPAKTIGPLVNPAAKASIGQPAPDFILEGVDGKKVQLSKFKGKTVVLEWFNPDCPFVKLAHNEGHLPKSAADHLKGGGVWLAINSGGKGKQGHGQARNKEAVSQYKLTWPVLLDETGVVGRAYDAKRTPHMYIIDPNGVLVYRGALDSSRGGGYENRPYTNYLVDALNKTLKKAPVDPTTTKSWGCSIKYAQ